MNVSKEILSTSNIKETCEQLLNILSNPIYNNQTQIASIKCLTRLCRPTKL